MYCSTAAKDCGTAGHKTVLGSYVDYQSYYCGDSYGPRTCYRAVQKWRENCVSCNSGTYNPSNYGSQTSCKTCPTGWSSYLQDDECYYLCDDGQIYISGSASNPVCEDCAAGTVPVTPYQLNVRNICVECEAGKYQDSAKQTACLDCEAGKISIADRTYCEDVVISQVNTKVDSIIADLAGGSTARSLSKTEVDDATVSLIRDIKNKKDKGKIAIIDLNKARKFTKAYVMMEDVKQERYKKAKTQEKQLAAQVYTLFTSERQSANATIKKAWKRKFVKTMKYALEPQNVPLKLAKVCSSGCSSSVSAPSAQIPNCSSYDNENCCSYDIADDQGGNVTLVQAFDVGNFTIMCNGSVIISKQEWTSEESYRMECWDADANEFGKTQENMTVGDEYKCNKYNVWIGSQGVTNGCDTCDDNASCDSSTDPVTCTCDAPFTGNGTHCDADQCSSLTDAHNCHADATCNNTDTGFTCACNAGFLGDGVNCEADQCLTDNGGCDADATCVDTFGADPVCTCKAGFVDWSPQDQTGMSCDPDQCQVANACATEADGGICTDDEDGYTCSCRPTVFVANTLAVGTINNNPVHQCVNVDECAENVDDCGTNYKCVDVVPTASVSWQRFSCICPFGYYEMVQNGQTVCIDINECDLPESDSRYHDCPDHSTCTNYNMATHNVTHLCMCNAGYQMAPQGGTDMCVDIDECQNITCAVGETCTNYDGGYTCHVGPLYAVNDTFCDDNDINTLNTPKSTCDEWKNAYNSLTCCGGNLACQVLQRKYRCAGCCAK